MVLSGIERPFDSNALLVARRRECAGDCRKGSRLVSILDRDRFVTEANPVPRGSLAAHTERLILSGPPADP